MESQLPGYDQQAAQDAQNYGRIVEKTIDDTVKVLIEAVYYVIHQRQGKVEINFDDPTQIKQNVKDALAAGGDDKAINLFLDQHTPIQLAKRQYPEQNQKLKDTIIQGAKADLLVEKHKDSPSFRQAQAQRQQQKQSQTQKRGQSQ